MTSIAPPALRRPHARRPFRSTRQAKKTGPGRGLSAERERELAARIIAGDGAARDELILGNRKLAEYFAAKFLKLRWHDVPLEDLAQEGTIGLIQAAERYDPAQHGTRFSTYAFFWIRARIRSACMNQGEPIRIPAYVHDCGEAAEWRAKIQHALTLGLEIPVDSEDPLESLAQREERDRLRHELARLTAAQRELLVWYVATSMGTYGRRKPGPPKKTRNRGAAARRLITKLRAKLNQEGSTNAY
jgi:RNA polymerase sigma factor (sigma-70 family)